VRIPLLACLLLLVASPAIAEPIQPEAIRVIDGDTITANGMPIRLVGFDTPEPENQARCEAERTRAAQATSRLRQLVAGGGLDLSLVPCSCKAGTEGTDDCNHRRACGVLTQAGRDVGATLIAEGLGPRRQPWC
jgi:endonuclease YncB( thermonuclease family)